MKKNDQPQSAGENVFWNMILHSFVQFFIKIESN